MSKLNRKHTTPREKREILQRLEQGETAAHLAQVYGIGRSTIFEMKKQSDRFRAKIQTNCQTVQRNQQPQNSATSTKRHERKILTLSEKSAILYRLEQGESGNMLATIFGIGKSTISDIKRNSAKIRGFISSSSHGPGTRKTLKKAKNPRVEKALYMWIAQATYKGVSVSGDVLASKAKYFYEQFTGNTDFIASNGWVERFKMRHGIKLSHLASDKSSSVKCAVQQFHSRLEQLVTGLVLAPSQIYLVTESCLSHQVMLAQNSQLSFMVCANSTGAHKLKMTVIGSAECLVKDCATVNVVEHANIWITRNILLQWFHDEFVPVTRAWQSENNMPGRAILLLPSAPGYPSAEELETDDKFIRTLFIPPNCKTLLQPMEQHVMQRIRTRYKTDILNKLMVQAHENITTIAPSIGMKEVLRILTNTWTNIPPSLINMSCRNILSTLCDPLVDLNSSSYADILKADQEETIKILSESVAETYGLTTEQITSWFESDTDKSSCHEMLTDNEIIEHILNVNETKPALGSISCEVKVNDDAEVFTNTEHTLNNETDSNTESVNVKSDDTVIIKSEDRISHKDAADAFDLCLKWANENNVPCHELTLLQQMKTQALRAANVEEFS